MVENTVSENYKKIQKTLNTLKIKEKLNVENSVENVNNSW